MNESVTQANNILPNKIHSSLNIFRKHFQKRILVQFNKKMKVDKNISEDEAALYDRQIRLWGVDAQKKYFSLFL